MRGHFEVDIFQQHHPVPETRRDAGITGLTCPNVRSILVESHEVVVAPIFKLTEGLQRNTGIVYDHQYMYRSRRGR
jgi:hypothetical protein